MTSPAIKAANQPKENIKSESSTGSESNIRNTEPEVRQTSPFTAWWRVFKLANLLMQQGC